MPEELVQLLTDESLRSHVHQTLCHHENLLSDQFDLQVIPLKQQDAAGCDMLALERGERRIMLPVHPLRMRWICCYLEETRKLAEAFLSGEAAFADGEGEMFLDWLENLTPRESPPLAVGQDGQLLYSRSEVAWFEDFSPERTETGDVGFDSDAVESIARRIVGYLETHPYKRDGLSLLVVLPTSDFSVRAN